MSDAGETKTLKKFRVEFATNSFQVVEVDVEAADEDDAIEEAKDYAYAGHCSDDWWKELISIEEIED